ncbi:desulfoferrodoxin [Tyzzerella sp. OttesenSCG-928-J15]|nr:desulfoferrodoxin [Tyzzerella sp. OttesenSCG-928-J15]
MKNERMFLKCEKCGNIVGMVHDAGVTPVCCGQEMTLLKANTVDAAQEKHVPVGQLEGNKLTVKVGDVAHPMLEEHHIAWVAVAQGSHTQRIALNHTGAPEAVFCVEPSTPVTIYAYCNLHGLWASDI